MAAKRRQPDYDLLQCATLGHNWETEAPRTIYQSRSTHTILVSCTSCTSERVDDIDQYGEVTYRSYEHSPRYRAFLDSDLGHRPRSQYRLMMIQHKPLHPPREEKD